MTRKSGLRKTLSRIWGRILCGIPVKEGNYSRYWGDCDDKRGIYENDIWEIGWFRSIIVDLLDRKGSWASHPRDTISQLF